MKPLSSCHLYTFVDLACLKDRDPLIIAEQLCAGGTDLLQLRAKNLTRDEIRKLAVKILPITERAGAGLVINDYLAIALEVGAPLCHLGQEDFYATGKSQLRDLKPSASTLGIGLSTHAPEQARAAEAAGADYLAIGPVYSTPSKPSAKPVSLEYVRWAAKHLSRPWFAIGGINFDTLDAVLEAGAKRVCVLSAILQSSNPERACQEFKNRLRGVGSKKG